MRPLAVKVLEENIGGIWLERDTIISINDITVGNRHVPINFVSTL
jgi:hypothetical protein